LYHRLHGNAKPQEPGFQGTLPKGNPRRLVMHDHPKRWSSSSAPGKKEHPELSNKFHRVWMTDGGTRGKWCKRQKEEFFAKQDKGLFRLRPHDEKFAHGTNCKMWTHLAEEGTARGGLNKLDYVPERQTGLHLKHGIYKGRFANVKHGQYIVCTGRIVEGEKTEMMRDERPLFDNRLKDDMNQTNWEETQRALAAACDVNRPRNTRSCPQLGMDFTWR